MVKTWYSGYGDEPTGEQGMITTQGNAFLNRRYPNLDYIKKATIE